MANLKRYVIGDQTGGTDPHICIQQDATGNFWNGSIFDVSQTLLPMSELFIGFFEYETSTAVFPDGIYNIAIYDGSSSAGVVLRGTSERIVSDTQMDGVALVSLAARNAVAAVSASLSQIKTSVDGLAVKVGVLDSKVESFNVTLARKGPRL